MRDLGGLVGGEGCCIVGLTATLIKVEQRGRLFRRSRQSVPMPAAGPGHCIAALGTGSARWGIGRRKDGVEQAHRVPQR